jgi:hypothetical protein
MCTEFAQFDESGEMAVRAHQTLLDAIPPFIWLGQSISHRLEQLSLMRIGPAITAAAAAAITAGKFTLALEWLQEGRNIIWGQLTRLRDPLDDLQAHDSSLADKLRETSARLEYAGRSSATSDSRTPAPKLITPGDASTIMFNSHTNLEEQAQRHRALAAEYEVLLAEIRQTEGFEGFLRPKTLAELAPACRDGPVVVVNVDRTRCDALALVHSERVIHIPLPRLSLKTVLAMRMSIVNAIQDRGVRHDIVETGERGVVPDKSHSGLRTVLESMWTRIVEPVLSAIKDEVSIIVTYHQSKELSDVS